MPGDPQSVALRFLNEDGVDLDEAAQRKIERLYDREESRRVLAAEIGDIGFASRTLELYTNELASLVDLDAIRAAKFKLVLDYAFGTASFVMPNVLAKLGADMLGINPNVSTVRRHRASTGPCTRPGWSSLVRSSGANLGAMLDPDGEQLTLVDDTGHVLEDDEALLALAQLVSTRRARGRDRRARGREPPGRGDLRRARRRRCLRTKLSAAQLLEAADSPRVALRGEHLGGLRLPPVPAGLRRRRHPRAPPVSARLGAASRSRSVVARCPRPTSSGGRYRPPSSRRASSCAPSSSRQTRPGWSCSTG